MNMLSPEDRVIVAERHLALLVERDRQELRDGGQHVLAEGRMPPTNLGEVKPVTKTDYELAQQNPKVQANISAWELKVVV